MDAHHPVRQTMVTGTNLEKQLPIFPCSDPQEHVHGHIYIYRWYSTFIYYLLCMTLDFKYSRPNPMDDQESHLPKSTAWNSSPAMMHCIALQSLSFPVNNYLNTWDSPQIWSTPSKLSGANSHRLWEKRPPGHHTACPHLCLPVELVPPEKPRIHNIIQALSPKHVAEFDHDSFSPGKTPWHSWISWQIPPTKVSCLPIGSSVTWHHIIGYNWTWNMHAVSDAETNLLRKTSQGEEEVNIFGLNWGQRKMPILSNQLQY